MAESLFFTEPRTPPATTFSGPQFFNVYKDSEFLRIDANVKNLLAQGYELRQKINNTVAPGEIYVVPTMFLEQNTPLLVKRTAKNIKVEDFEFTYNRLIGLAAGFAYENRRRFPSIQSSEANALGLVWDNENDDKAKMYLSAISGTEHMIDQFSFCPLLCALRKFQLKKMPIELVVKSGNIKNSEGLTMAKVLKQHLVTAKRLWLMFPGASLRDLQTMIDSSPELRRLFQG